jgi:hypothetical protein
MPELPEQLKRFLATAPSYDDDQEVAAVGWSSGHHGGNYMKLSKAYCGDVASFGGVRWRPSGK